MEGGGGFELPYSAWGGGRTTLTVGVLCYDVVIGLLYHTLQCSLHCSSKVNIAVTQGKGVLFGKGYTNMITSCFREREAVHFVQYALDG